MLAVSSILHLIEKDLGGCQMRMSFVKSIFENMKFMNRGRDSTMSVITGRAVDKAQKSLKSGDNYFMQKNNQLRIRLQQIIGHIAMTITNKMIKLGLGKRMLIII